MTANLIRFFLLAHIVCGAASLALGIVAMVARKRRGLHTRVGIIYFWLVAVVCASALPLSVNDWRENWFFVGIAVFSFSFALKGYRAFWRRGPGLMVRVLLLIQVQSVILRGCMMAIGFYDTKYFFQPLIQQRRQVSVILLSPILQDAFLRGK
jgi:hypothetical protein